MVLGSLSLHIGTLHIPNIPNQSAPHLYTRIHKRDTSLPNKTHASASRAATSIFFPPAVVGMAPKRKMWGEGQQTAV